MRHPTTVFTPSVPPAHHPAALPDPQSLLQELGALYPAVAFADDADFDRLTEPIEGRGLDEDALDEAIFAGMVALR
jgi:hypothetical protein